VLARHAIPGEALIFLLVGSGYERKGVAAAIEALRELPPHAHLVVVGRETRLVHYRGLAARLGVGSRVTFAGPQIDPKPYFGAADAFVLPTLYDPFPNAALEAMASGVPVITSTKSGAAELVVERDAGFVCASRDVAALARCMNAMLESGDRARMAANARAAVLPFTPEAMTLELVLLYKRLLEESVAERKAAAARRSADRAGKLARLAQRAADVPGPAPARAIDDDVVASSRQASPTQEAANVAGGTERADRPSPRAAPDAQPAARRNGPAGDTGP
jgi:hypothetical protein